MSAAEGNFGENGALLPVCDGSVDSNMETTAYAFRDDMEKGVFKIYDYDRYGEGQEPKRAAEGEEMYGEDNRHRAAGL